MSIEEEIARERNSINRVKELARELAIAAAPIWSHGDGFGGQVKVYSEEAFDAAGLPLGPQRGA